MSATSIGSSARRPERYRKSKRALAVLLALVVSLSLCEIALRLLWHNSYGGDEGSSFLRLHLQHANRDYILPRGFLDPETPQVHLRTDGRSYILPSFQHAEPDATIAFFGGSTTECSIVKEELRFPALAGTLLAQSGLAVNTLNVASAGTTAHDSVNVLYNHVAFDHPDIAVLMHATNDFGVLAVDGDYRSRAGRPLEGPDQMRWLKERLSRNVYLAAFVRKVLADRGVRYQQPDQIAWRNSEIANLPVGEFRKSLEAFVELCGVFGIQPVLMTQPLASSTNKMTPPWANPRAQDRFNQEIRAVGADHGVLVIDLARHIVEDVPSFDAPGEIFFDGMHVTDKGSRAYAEYIVEHLRPLVTDVAARRRSP